MVVKAIKKSVYNIEDEDAVDDAIFSVTEQIIKKNNREGFESEHHLISYLFMTAPFAYRKSAAIKVLRGDRLVSENGEFLLEKGEHDIDYKMLVADVLSDVGVGMGKKFEGMLKAHLEGGNVNHKKLNLIKDYVQARLTKRDNR